MKILIIDDHKIFCSGLKLILASRADQPTVLEADNCQLGLELASREPDLNLVMLDLNLPDMDGFEALRIFAQRHPSLPVVILTASESRHNMHRCFEAGASGFIPKSSNSKVLMSAIDLVLAGGTYIPASLALAGTSAIQPRKKSNGPDALKMLTTRQTEVLNHLKDGISNKQIAERMDISESTVKIHISAILKALGVRSRLEAALFAQQLSHPSA